MVSPSHDAQYLIEVKSIWWCCWTWNSFVLSWLSSFPKCFWGEHEERTKCHQVFFLSSWINTHGHNCITYLLIHNQIYTQVTALATYIISKQLLNKYLKKDSISSWQLFNANKNSYFQETMSTREMKLKITIINVFTSY